MVGKFDSITPGLPVLPPEIRYNAVGGAAYQAKVDEAKGEFQDRKPSVLLTQYGDLRAQAEVKEREAKDLWLRVEAAAQLITEAYEAEGIPTMTVRGVGTMRTDHVPYAHVEDRGAFHEWALDHGYGPQMSLPWMTTNSIVKEMLLGGEDAPPGVTVYVKPTPVFTRDKS